MIDKAQIEAGKDAMKALLIDRRATERLNFLGPYHEGRTTDDFPDAFELEGAIDIADLAQAFMRGAGIEPISDVAALQAEVAQLRAEVEELRATVATMRLVPRADGDQRSVRVAFTPLNTGGTREG